MVSLSVYEGLGLCVAPGPDAHDVAVRLHDVIVNRCVFSNGLMGHRLGCGSFSGLRVVRRRGTLLALLAGEDFAAWDERDPVRAARALCRVDALGDALWCLSRSGVSVRGG